MLKTAAVWLFPKEVAKWWIFVLGVRIRSGEGVFWKAIWENQMKRLVLKNE